MWHTKAWREKSRESGCVPPKGNGKSAVFKKLLSFWSIRTYTSSNDLIFSVHISQTPCRCYIWEIDVNKQQTSFPLPLPLKTGVRDIFRSEASPFICWSMWWTQALWEQISSSLITLGEDGKGTASPGSHWVLQGSLFFWLNYSTVSPQFNWFVFLGGISPAGRGIYPSPRGIKGLTICHLNEIV